MRMAYWFGFAAVAGAFGGLIAFGIQHAHAAVANWKLLFIVEGLPTILIGLLSMLILPNRPEETTMFNEKERELALERANRGIKADTGRVVNRGEEGLVLRRPDAHAAPDIDLGVFSQATSSLHSRTGAYVTGPRSILTTDDPTHVRLRCAADLRRRRNVLRRELRARVHLRLPSHHHHDLRIQCASFSPSSADRRPLTADC